MTPPRDRHLAGLLAALRDTVARLESASLEGSDTTRLSDRQTRLETEVRDRSRSAAGDFASAARLPDPAELKRALGERSFSSTFSTWTGSMQSSQTAKGSACGFSARRPRPRRTGSP